MEKNKDNKDNNNNSSNSLVFGRSPQTKIILAAPSVEKNCGNKCEDLEKRCSWSSNCSKGLRLLSNEDPRHSFPHLYDDEHVVDADAEEQEGDDGVHVGEEDLHVKAKAERGAERKADHQNSHHGDENLKQRMKVIDHEH